MTAGFGRSLLNKKGTPFAEARYEYVCPCVIVSAYTNGHFYRLISFTNICCAVRVSAVLVLIELCLGKATEQTWSTFHVVRAT